MSRDAWTQKRREPGVSAADIQEMLTPARSLAAAALVGLLMIGVMADALDVAGRDAPAVAARPELASGVAYAHRGLPAWAEVGYRSAAPMQLSGTFQRDRDATGPTFVLALPDGARLRVAYANNGDAGLERALREAHGAGRYRVTGTVLDWGRGVRSFDMGRPFTMARVATP